MTRAIFLNDDLKKSFLVTNPNMSHIEHKMIQFNGGEPHIKISDDLVSIRKDSTDIVFITKLTSPKEVLELAIAVDAIERAGLSGSKFHLYLGYLPGSRQDRVCENGEALTCSVYARMINTLTFWSSVQFIDSHSNVMPALLNNSIPIDNKHFVDVAIEELDLEDFTLISPDAGASPKIIKLAQHINTSKDIKVDVVRADKLRDTTNGQILETLVFADDLTGKDCVIVDDICDGGRTFIELAKVLRNKGARNVILIVTHGIFSKGYDVVLEHVDQIVTTNSFADLTDDTNGSVTVIGLNPEFYTYK